MNRPTEAIITPDNLSAGTECVSMQPQPGQNPAMQDSVVGGNLHTGNVVHNHYHTPAQAQPVPQTVHTVVHQQQPRLAMAQTGNKDLVVAYLLWFFIGILGGHRFYLGHIGIGILYLMTFGGFFIGWMIDALQMPALVKAANGQLVIIR